MNAKNHLHLSFIPLLNIWSGSIIRLLYQTLPAAWVLNAFGREKPLCVATFAQRIQSKRRSLSLDVLKAQRAPLQGCNHRLKDSSANYRRKVFRAGRLTSCHPTASFCGQFACSFSRIARHTLSPTSKLTSKKKKKGTHKTTAFTNRSSLQMGTAARKVRVDAALSTNRSRFSRG